MKNVQIFDSSLFIGLFIFILLCNDGAQLYLTSQPLYYTLKRKSKGCLFGGVELAKNADPDKYVYNGYGIEFDTRIKSSLPDNTNILLFLELIWAHQYILIIMEKIFQF